jgi:flagellar basal body-associated protein FliL
MHKKILILAAGLVVLSTAAVVVGGAGGDHEAPVDWLSRRGQESYYAPEVLTFDLRDISVNLKGTDGQRYLFIGFNVAYRIGPEVKNGPAAFARGEADLRDRLTLLLSNKTIADVDSKEKKLLLQQEILDQVQQAVFPDKTGRVEKVYFKNFLIQ